MKAAAYKQLGIRPRPPRGLAAARRAEQGSPDRYEQVRKAFDMRSQAFQRLLYWMRGYGLVRVRAERPSVAYRAGVLVHL